MSEPYRKLLVFLLSLLVLSAGSRALAQVGIVHTVEGRVSVLSGKLECAPRFGLDLDEGDAVRTGEKSWAILNMMDGAKITVRPDTEVRVYTYRYAESGEPSQSRALLILTSGALRVLAGRIATGSGSGFVVRTPDASMELRGADHDITYLAGKLAYTGDAQAGTYGRVYTGAAVIKSPGGEVSLRDGQTAYAEARTRAAPRLVQANPYFYHWHGYIDRRAAAVAEKLELSAP